MNTIANLHSAVNYICWHRGDETSYVLFFLYDCSEVWAGDD